MKKIISLVLIAVLMFTVTASAEGWRIYPSKNTLPKVDKSSYHQYWDFTDVEEGVFPAGVSGNKAGVSTAINDVDGVKKNCLQIVDDDHTKTWSGINAYFNLTPLSGMVEYKIRYKYLRPASGESRYGQYQMQLFDSAGTLISKMVISSENGNTRFNSNGNGQTDLELQMINNDTWYTVTMIFDFEAKQMDVQLTNEGKGVSYIRQATSLYTDAGGKDLSRITFEGQCYGGTYVIDYASVRKVNKRLTPDRSYLKNIEKGVEQIKTPSPISLKYTDRVNIVKDGVYKYTTKAPYVSDKGNVMVTAKNIADILDLGYDIKDGKYIITSGDKVLEFTAGNESGLSEATVLKDGQLFVPIKDVLDALGIAYTFDADTLTIG